MLEEKIYALIPWVLSLTTAAALALAWYAWRRRQERRGADWLAFTLFCAALWTACDLFNFLADLPVLESNLKRATWYLILAAGFGFFRFACVHARREHWWEAAQLPVGIALSVNLLLMATNAAHGLIWPGEHWLAFGSARVPWLESGPAFFWVFRPTAYGLPLAGVAALVASAAGSPRFYLRQVIALTAGALVPVLANGVFVSTSVPGLDVTPVAVVGAITAFGWSALRFGLLDVMPVAWSVLLEQLDDGVVALDKQLCVVDLNPAAERLLGCRGWTPGTPVEQVLPFWKRVRERVERADAKPAEVDLGNEAETVLELAASPVRREDGAVVGRVLMLRDVSARARLVRELDAYAQTVARDLKLPLGALIGSIEDLCQEERLSDDSHLYLRTAAQVSRQMDQTIDALLCFAKLRSMEEADVQPLDMARIVEATLRRLSAAIAKTKAEIHLPERWPPAVGHPIWVEEIWTNYISNAIKYGGSPPRIEVGAVEHGERAARYWVRDDGPGLTEEQRARLFTEFTRLDPKRSEGHGLGLSIVQRIAEKLGGQVGCDSSPGAGSTFWFTLASAQPARQQQASRS